MQRFSAATGQRSRLTISLEQPGEAPGSVGREAFFLHEKGACGTYKSKSKHPRIGYAL